MNAAAPFINTAANWTAENPILPATWIGHESDTGRFKQGDGLTSWTSLPYVGGGGVLINKTATETIASDNTLSNDAALQFAAAASTKYRIKIVAWFDTTAAADFKFALTGPASPTLIRILRRHIDPNALTALIIASEVDYTASTAVNAGTGTTGGFVEFEIDFHNGINAGTFAFQWAQNTSNASNTSVLAGSYLSYILV